MLKKSEGQILFKIVRLSTSKPKKMKRFLVVFPMLSFLALGQTTNYDDVGVIINDNSQASIDIANYFQNARNIPQANMIHINCSTAEEIDSLEFENIRGQVEDYLITNGLENSLNYLVTTKGIPLKISNGCQLLPPYFMTCSSVDSELSLILGSYTSYMLDDMQMQNPYFSASSNFSRQSFGIYLVTRLDGYTVGDVFKMINNSGPETPLNQHQSTAIVDLNNASGGDSTYFLDNHLLPSEDYLSANLWNSEYDWGQSPLTNKNDVFTYLTTGHGPLTNVSLLNTWTNGSFAAMATCATAATFDASANPDDNFLLADLIAEGCTGGLGYINCVYFQQIYHFGILVDRYLDSGHEYNLAESFYMGDPTLSWQTVVVGDPKASVYITNPNTLSTATLTENSLKVFPNPSKGTFIVDGLDINSELTVRDLTGKVLFQTTAKENSFELNLTNQTSGIYFLEGVLNGNKVQSKLVKE